MLELKEAKTYLTDDFESFAFAMENRDKIEKRFFNELKDSIKSTSGNVEAIKVIPYDGRGSIKGYPEECKIIVNGVVKTVEKQLELSSDAHVKYVVIEGMNRMLACSELGIKAKVQIDPTIKREHLDIINTKKFGWKLINYIHNRKFLGVADCAELLSQYKIYSKQGFTLPVIVEAFKDSSVKAKAKQAVMDKTYKIDVSKGSTILNGALRFSNVILNASGDSKPTGSQFVKALTHIFEMLPTTFDPQATADYMKSNDLVVRGLTGTVTEIKDFILDKAFYRLFDTEDRTLNSKGKAVVKEAYAFKCAKCKLETNTEVDHVQDVAKHGKTTIENSQPLCYSCHDDKPLFETEDEVVEAAPVKKETGSEKIKVSVNSEVDVQYDKIVLTNHAINRVSERYSNISTAEFIRMIDTKDKEWVATELDKETGDTVYTITMKSEGENLVLKGKIDTVSREGYRALIIITFYTYVTG